MVGESEAPKFQPNFRVESTVPTPEVKAFVGAAGVWLSSLNLPNEHVGSVLRQVVVQSKKLSPDELLMGGDVFLALMRGSEVALGAEHGDQRPDLGGIAENNNQLPSWRSQLDMGKYTPHEQPVPEFRQFLMHKQPHFDQLTSEQVDHLLGEGKELREQFYDGLYDKIVDYYESRKENYKLENFHKEVDTAGLYIAVLAAAGEGFSLSDIAEATGKTLTQVKYILGATGRGLSAKIRGGGGRKAYSEVYERDITPSVEVETIEVSDPTKTPLVVSSPESGIEERELSPHEKAITRLSEALRLSPEDNEGLMQLFSTDDTTDASMTRKAAEALQRELHDRNILLGNVVHNPVARTVLERLLYGLPIGEGERQYTTFSNVLAEGRNNESKKACVTAALSKLANVLDNTHSVALEAEQAANQEAWEWLERALPNNKSEVEAIMNNALGKTNEYTPTAIDTLFTIFSMRDSAQLDKTQLAALRGFVLPNPGGSFANLDEIAQALSTKQKVRDSKFVSRQLIIALTKIGKKLNERNVSS